MREKMLRAIVGAAALLAIDPTPATAVTYLAYVSAIGNDSRPCTLEAQPCKTVQRAIDVSGAGGTIRILSNLPGQTAVVTKSLTIEGGDNTMIGTIVINSPSAIVAVRNLDLTGRHAVARGINIVNAAAVHIEDCTTERYTQQGIDLGADVSTELYVSNSISRENLDGLRVSALTTAKVTVENSHFVNNKDHGFLLEALGQGSISRSTASGNRDGIVITGGKLNVTSTTATGNTRGFVLHGGQMTLSSVVASDNITGLYLDGGRIVARLTKSIITNNTVGVTVNGGIVRSLRVNGAMTNVIENNASDFVGGSLTPLDAQ